MENTEEIQSDNNPFSLTYYQIAYSANVTSHSIEVNNAIPTILSMGNHHMNPSEYLYVLCKGLNTTNNVEFSSMTYTKPVTGTNKADYNITRYHYLDLANYIMNIYETYGCSPRTIKSSNYTFNFDDCLYLYSRIFAYRYNHDKYKVLNAIKTTAQTCIDTARDLIISYEVKNTINDITGWGLT